MGTGEPMSDDDDIIRFKEIEVMMSVPDTTLRLTTVSVSNGVVELSGTIQIEVAYRRSRMTVNSPPNAIEAKNKRSALLPYQAMPAEDKPNLLVVSQSSFQEGLRV